MEVVEAGETAVVMMVMAVGLQLTFSLVFLYKSALRLAGPLTVQVLYI